MLVEDAHLLDELRVGDTVSLTDFDDWMSLLLIWTPINGLLLDW